MIELGVPESSNGSAILVLQKSLAAPQLKASNWLIHDSRAHFWQRGSYTQHQSVKLYKDDGSHSFLHVYACTF